MKVSWNKQYTTIAIYAFLVIGASIIFKQFVAGYSVILGGIGVLIGMLMPFVYGLCIAYILNPIVKISEKKVLEPIFKDKLSKGFKRGLSVFLSVLVVFLGIGCFFSAILPQVAKSISSIASQIPDYVAFAEESFNKFISHHSNNPFVLSILKEVSESGKEIMDSLYNLLSSLAPRLINVTILMTKNIIKVGIQIIVGLIISVYILLSKEKFFAQAKKLLFSFFPDKYAYAIISITHNSNKIFTGFISGKILDSLIIGLLCFGGMSVLHLHYSVLISVIVGLTNIIPYFGPFIGAIPSALFLLIISPLEALIFCIFVLILQQIDGNIIGPKILGNSTGLSAIWVIFAITIFGGIWGVLGMFIGVPLFAVIYSLIKAICEYRLEKKGKSTSTFDYASKENPIITKPKKKPTLKERLNLAGKNPNNSK